MSLNSLHEFPSLFYCFRLKSRDIFDIASAFSFRCFIFVIDKKSELWFRLMTACSSIVLHLQYRDILTLKSKLKLQVGNIPVCRFLQSEKTHDVIQMLIYNVWVWKSFLYLEWHRYLQQNKNLRIVSVSVRSKR